MVALVCTCTDVHPLFQAVLGSLGGVQLLFPILEQACLEMAERRTMMASQSPQTHTIASSEDKMAVGEDGDGGDKEVESLSPSKTFRGVDVLWVWLLQTLTVYNYLYIHTYLST